MRPLPRDEGVVEEGEGEETEGEGVIVGEGVAEGEER